MKWRRAGRPPPGSAIGMEGKRRCPVCDLSGSGIPDSPAPRGTARPLLLLPLPLDVELPLLAPDLRRGLPLELVPLDRQLVLDGDLHPHHLPIDGERQHPTLERRVLERRLLLVLEGHRAGELAPVLLDGQ